MSTNLTARRESFNERTREDFQTILSIRNRLQGNSNSIETPQAAAVRRLVYCRSSSSQLDISSGFETDLSTCGNWNLAQFFQFIKNEPEVFVVGGKLTDNERELVAEFFIGIQHLPHFYEGPHDSNVDFDSTFTSQYA